MSTEALNRWQLPPVTVHSRWLAEDLSEQLPWWLTDYGMPAAWDKSTAGKGILVGMADTGVDKTHYESGDLAGQIKIAKDFTRSLNGWADTFGHGTHTAGIVAAKSGNQQGIAGMAPAAQLVIAKVLGDDGQGDDRGLANGLLWLGEQGCQVVNLSLGSSAPSQPVASAINQLANAGIIVVCAAGNDGGQVNYPAKWAAAIAIAASDRQRKAAPFTCHGPEVAASAPGVEILSTYKRGTYAVLSGTSMACPWVSGFIANKLAWDQLKGNKPLKTADDVRAWLANCCKDAGSPGRDDFFGAGLPDPASAFADAPQPPVVAPIPVTPGLSMVVPGGVVTFTPTK